MSARGDALYDVVVLGFDLPLPEVVDGLSRVFGLDEVTAQALISALPATVCHDVNEIRAEYFRRALCSIGARVEVRSGPHAVPADLPAPAPANDVTVPPSAAGDRPSGRSATLLMGSDPLAATLNALPAPQLPAAEASLATSARTAVESRPAGARAGSELGSRDTDLDAETSRQVLSPAPAADAVPRWGELVREPQKPRPAPLSLGELTLGLRSPDAYGERALPSAPLPARPRPDLAAYREPPLPGPGPRLDPAAYGERSLPPAADGVQLASLSPVAPHPGRERVSAQPSPGRAPALNVPKKLPIPAARPESRRVEAAPPVPPGFVEHDDASFWPELPALLSFPWRESGWQWFVVIGLWAVGANLLSALAKVVPLVGTWFVLMLNSSVLALSADYHRRCMWAVANAEGPLQSGPDLDPVRILHTYMRSGLHLLGFMLVSQLPLTAWLVNRIMEEGFEGGLELVLSRRFWLLSMLPGLYWPMAVATASLYNRFQGVWYVPVGLRALLRAPLEYACIAAIGTATFLVPWLICTLIGRAVGLPGIFFLAVAALPLAASHAVMGTLTGQLMRARPQLFESAAD